MPRITSWLSSSLLVAAIGAVGCTVAARDTGDGDPASAGRLTMSEGELQLFFTDPLPDLISRKVLDGADPRIQKLAATHPGDGARPDEQLVALIDAEAQGEGCSLLVSDYDFDVQEIADAMARAKTRGCDVRMVTDGDTVSKSDPSPDRPHRTKTFDPGYQKPFDTLRAAGIPVRDDGPRGAIMHNKFAVVNGEYVWSGSWNMSQDDTTRFWNNAALMRSAEAAKRFTATFEYLYKKYDPDVPIPREPAEPDPDPATHTFELGGRRMELYFPRAEPALKRIAEVASGAKKSIHFMAFSFPSSDLGDALLDRAAHGVDVQGVFENSGACSGQYKALEAATSPAKDHIAVQRWIYGPTNFMHHKVLIIDATTVVFASFNFSDSANGSNDENVMIVTDPKVAATFEAEYERLSAVTALTKQPPPCTAAAQSQADVKDLPQSQAASLGP
jgi:phosphatidylserine/phosphatidylglycerophosphate/cardiolipin synthase-like enzyme